MKSRLAMVVLILVFIQAFSFAGQRSSPFYKNFERLESTNLFDYLTNTSDENLSITISALILSKDFFPKAHFKPYIDEIDRLASNVIDLVGNTSDPDQRIGGINTTLYRDNPYGYDLRKGSWKLTKNHFLVGLIDSKKGVCTSLPLLYLCLAERLGYPIFAVRAPQHHFCRYVAKNFLGKGKDRTINIEPTCGGGESPDIFYIEDMSIPKDAYLNGVYMKTMTKREYIYSLMIGNAAVHYSQSNLSKAYQYAKKSLMVDTLNSLGWSFMGVMNQNMAYKEVSMIESAENEMAFLRTKANLSPDKQFDSYFPSQGSKGFSKQDILNRSISSGPNSQQSSASGQVEALNLSIETRVRNLRYLDREYRVCQDNVSALGMAKPTSLDYWEKYFENTKVKLEGDLENGKIKTVKQTINGVDFEISLPMKRRLDALTEKYPWVRSN